MLLITSCSLVGQLLMLLITCCLKLTAIDAADQMLLTAIDAADHMLLTSWTAIDAGDHMLLTAYSY